MSQILFTASVTKGSALVTAVAGVDLSSIQAGYVFATADANDTYEANAVVGQQITLKSTYNGPTNAAVACLVCVDYLPDGTPLLNTGDTEIWPLFNLLARKVYSATQSIPTPGTTPVSYAAGNDSRFAFTFTPEMFGAVGDGVADDTAHVLAASDAAVASGGRLYLAKTYLLSSGITGTGNITIEGPGTLLCGFATGDILHYAPANAPASGTDGDLADTDGLQHLAFRGFQIQTTVQRTSGCAIYVQYAFNPVFERLTVGKFDIDTNYTLPMWDGIYCSRSANPRILNNDIRCRHKVIALSGGVGQNDFQFDGLISGNEGWGSFTPGSVAVHIGGDTGGCVLGPNSFSQFEQGLLVDTSLEPAPNRELFIHGHCFFDSLGLYGIHVAANSLAIFRTSDLWVAGVGRMSSGAAGGNVGVGVYIEPQAAGIYVAINGAHVYACTGHGIRLSGAQATLTGATVRDNGSGSSGGCGFLADSNAVVTVAGGEIINNATAQMNMTGAFVATLTGVNTQSAGGKGPGLLGAASYAQTVTGCAGLNDTGRTFNGTVTTQGPAGSFHIVDRTTGDGWDLYATGGTFFLFNRLGQVFAVDLNGAIFPNQLADSAVPGNRLYFSTTSNKLTYKDASGTIHQLYS